MMVGIVGDKEEIVGVFVELEWKNLELKGSISIGFLSIL